MHVTVRLYAELAHKLNNGQRTRTVALPDGSSVADLLAELKTPFQDGLIVGLNGRLADRGAMLHEGDELELLTVMEGGRI